MVAAKETTHPCLQYKEDITNQLVPVTTRGKHSENTSTDDLYYCSTAGEEVCRFKICIQTANLPIMI